MEKLKMNINEMREGLKCPPSIIEKRTMIRNSMNYMVSDKSYEKITGPSMTVPDMTYSIKELFIRQSQGQTLTQKDSQYSDTEDFEDYSMLPPDHDLTDTVTKYEQYPLGVKPRAKNKQKEPSDITAEQKRSGAQRNDDSSEAVEPALRVSAEG